MHPDPAGLAAVDPTNPQSWNRYAYVLNNPLKYIDPNGLDCIYLDDGGSGVVSIRPGDCVSEYDEGYYVPGTVTGIVTNAGQVTGVTLDSSMYDWPVGFDYNSGASSSSDSSGNNSGDFAGPFYLDLSGLPNQIVGEIGRRLTPKVCGGGGFVFAGGQLKIPGTNVHGELLGVFNYDSKSGPSAGGIGEVKVFGPFHAGGEVAYNFRSNKVSGEGLGFLGHETASAKFGAFGGGLLASSHGDVGGYGFVGPFGGGGYATLVLADTPCKP